MVCEKFICITCSIFTKSSCDLTILLIASNKAGMKFVKWGQDFRKNHRNYYSAFRFTLRLCISIRDYTVYTQ